jgi:phosphoglycolate phosphatase-like HAD superfamily hydrolase
MKLFVWDYHGTLEKGNELAALDISNRALEKFGYTQRFTAQDAVDLYGKKWYEYFEYLLPNETPEVHTALQEACFEWPEADKIVAAYLQPNDFAQEVVAAIHRKSHTQILISNTTDRALPIFVAQAGLSDYFGTANAFAVAGHARDVKRSKTDVLAEYVASLTEPPEIILIGDSQKDVELMSGENVKAFWYRHPTLPMAVTDKPHITPINDLRAVLTEL